MPRALTLAVGLLAAASTARSEEAITPETVAAIKKAAVFVRVEGDTWAATGSGFVVAADDKGVLVATNHHVASPTPPTPRPSPRPTPTATSRSSGSWA